MESWAWHLHRVGSEQLFKKEWGKSGEDEILVFQKNTSDRNCSRKWRSILESAIPQRSPDYFFFLIGEWY